jgi:ribosomal protein L29
MKSKEKKQLIGKAVSELQSDVKKLKSELVTLRLDQLQGKLKNTSAMAHKRRDIAVIKTVMKIKEMNNENI